MWLRFRSLDREIGGNHPCTRMGRLPDFFVVSLLALGRGKGKWHCGIFHSSSTMSSLRRLAEMYC